MCQTVRETVVPIPWLYTYVGEAHSTISGLCHKMFQAGILSMYYVHEVFNAYYREKRTMEALEHLEAKKEVPFTMTDWKMLSIFLGWGGCLGMAFLALFVEKAVKILAHRVLTWGRNEILISMAVNQLRIYCICIKSSCETYYSCTANAAILISHNYLCLGMLAVQAKNRTKKLICPLAKPKDNKHFISSQE